MMIGIGCWTGMGFRPARSMRCHLPSKSTIGLRPEAAQNLDLLLDAAAAGMEVLVQRLVFDVIPAESDAEPQPAAAQHVDFRRLLRDEHRLALRQDENPRDELDIRGEGGHVAEHDERLVERVGGGVTPAPVRTGGGIGAEHVVVGQDMVEAKPFGGLGVVAEDAGVSADFGLWESNADLHEAVSS